MKHKTRKRAIAPTGDHALRTLQKRSLEAIRTAQTSEHSSSLKEDQILHFFVDHSDRTFLRECSIYALVKHAIYSTLSSQNNRKKIHTIKVLKNLLRTPTAIGVGINSPSECNHRELIFWLLNEAYGVLENSHGYPTPFVATAFNFIQDYKEYKDAFTKWYALGLPPETKAKEDMASMKKSSRIFAREYLLKKLAQIHESIE